MIRGSRLFLLIFTLTLTTLALGSKARADECTDGEFGWIDVAAGRFTPVAFCPGYTRGLSFLGDFALLGISLPRDNRTFTGLALDEALASRGAEPRCAILVIDLRTGDTVHWVRFTGVVKELYDVVALPGIRRPSAIGFKSDEIRRVITVGAPAAA